MDAPKDLFQRFLLKHFHHCVNLAQLMRKKPIKRAQNDAEIVNQVKKVNHTFEVR